MPTIIKGKELAAKLRAELAVKISGREKTDGRPGLAVIQVGEDPASSIYVRNKQKACQDSGIRSYGYKLDSDVSEKELLDLIATLNRDKAVNGILCQLPLPGHLDAFTVTRAIAPEKDVDGFHPFNVGLLSMGRDCLVPCTPAGILVMLKAYNLPIKGQRCVIIGRSNIVGKPVAQLMIKEHATVTIAHSRTQNLPELCREADILIAAIGRARFVDRSFVKPGATVIDVGINRDEDGKVVGDVNYDDVKGVVGAITPVPGGVGPMTIAMLLANTYQAFLTQNNLTD